MDITQIKQNRSKLILLFAIPSIIAMVLTAMINLVDGYFTGNFIGKEGLAAINLGLPIIYLYLALGLMIAVGGISIAGRLLGAKRIAEANNVFRQTITLCLIITVALSIIFYFTIDAISSLIKVDSLTKGYFVTYYKILIIELPLIVIISALGMFIRGEGSPVFVMFMNLLSVVLNIILDYLFVAKFSLGIAGIAWASVISVSLVLIINLLYFTHSKVFKLGNFSWEKASIKETFLNGGSEFIGELSMCISMAAYNAVVLNKAGVEGIAAFTIIGYVSYIFSMIIIGFGQGIVPILSYSYGAGEKELAIKVRNTTFKMVTLSAVVVFLAMSLFSNWYSGLFSKSLTIKEMVKLGLKIQMSSFAFAGINTITSFYFTSIGKAKESAVISASRGLVVLMIAILVLPAFFGLTGVWLVSLTTEAITLIFSIYYMKKNKKSELHTNCND